jgi:hypothetical protein
MSRHRDTVTNLVEAVASCVEKGLSELVVQELLATGREQHDLRLFDPLGSAPIYLSVIAQRAEAMLLANPVDDFRDASVSVLLSQRERIGRCVAGDAMTARRLRLVDVSVKAGLRTRWVHIFAERQGSRQWVIA